MVPIDDRSAITNAPHPGGNSLLKIAATGGLSNGTVSCYPAKSWSKPLDGGKPPAYKTQHHPCPEGPWGDVSMAIESEITLSDQPRGTEWEYRVIAVNKADDGLPSNTVMAVL